MPRRTLLLLLPGLLLACNTLTPATPTAATIAPVTEPTTLPPTEAPPPTLRPAIPGWLTYHNAMIGYSFDYPPGARLVLTGVNGFPAEEQPPGIEVGEYFATLEAAYPEAICAGIELAAAEFVIWIADDVGGRYAGPCGQYGTGLYDYRSEEIPVTIDGKPYVMRLTRAYEMGTDILHDEFGGLTLEDGTRLRFGGTWLRQGLDYEDYLADKAILLQVLQSYRREG